MSGNPSGRPKGAAGLAELVRDKIHENSSGNGGNAIVDWVWGIFSSTTEPFENKKWAAEWLIDRGFGKAMQTIDVTSGGERLISPVVLMSPEKLALVDAYMRGEVNELAAGAIDAESEERADIAPPLALPKVG